MSYRTVVDERIEDGPGRIWDARCGTRVSFFLSCAGATTKRARDAGFSFGTASLVWGCDWWEG